MVNGRVQMWTVVDSGGRQWPAGTVVSFSVQYNTYILVVSRYRASGQGNTDVDVILLTEKLIDKILQFVN